MGGNSENEVNDWVDGWEPASEWAGEEKSEILSESDGSTAVLTVQVQIFLLTFVDPSQLCSS